MATRATLNWPVMQMSRHCSQSAGSISSTRPVGPAMPALLIRQSRPPSCLIAVVHHLGDLIAIGDVAQGAGGTGRGIGKIGQCIAIDVANVDPGPFAQKGLRGLQTDATGAGCHQYA